MSSIRTSTAAFLVSTSIFFGCGAPPVEDATGTSETSAASAAAAPVSLISATVPWAHTGMYDFPSQLVARIQVANLAYEKKVWIHYRVTMPMRVIQDWTDQEAQWKNGNDWEARTPSYTVSCSTYCNNLSYEFVIGYQVAGQTYWDNNGGANYHLGTDVEPMPSDPGPPALLGANNVMLWSASWTASDNTLSGTMIVSNLAFQKTVQVLFSTDGWKTSAWADAQYNLWTTHGLEYWKFSIAMPSGATQVDFAIRYQVAGQIFWDNNAGLNYHFNPS